MKRSFSSLGVALACLALGAVSCKAGSNNNNVGGAGDGGTTGTGAGGGGTGGDGDGGLNLGGKMEATGGSGGGITCVPGGDEDDIDMDGFTPNEGDCEDCDPGRNPNAIEVKTEPGGTEFDEDCDGQIDEDDFVTCDAGLAVDESDPVAGAHAMEICKTSSGPKDWGITGAKWVLADGTEPAPFDEVNFNLGHGMLSAFGYNVTVREGDRMLALSSGTARQPSDPGYQSVNGFAKGYICAHPMGFPKESPACPGSVTGQPNDATGLELTLLTPSNAKGFSFDFNFYTFEWPGFVCSPYNDFFVAILSPIPPGQPDGNISFDKDGNPVSVNNAFISVCGCEGNPPAPCFAGGKTFECPLGDLELMGTGFGFDTNFGQDHGATSWLRTSAPVEGGAEITIRFATYDSGDGVLDSTTLIDNFAWIAKPGTVVGTDVVPK